MSPETIGITGVSGREFDPAEFGLPDHLNHPKQLPYTARATRSPR